MKKLVLILALVSVPAFAEIDPPKFAKDDAVKLIACDQPHPPLNCGRRGKILEWYKYRPQLCANADCEKYEYRVQFLGTTGYQNVPEIELLAD